MKDIIKLMVVYLVDLSSKLQLWTLSGQNQDSAGLFVFCGSFQGRSTVSDERYHPEMGYEPSSLQLLLQPFLLVFVASKNAAIPLLELTRTMVRLHFKFCYFSSCLTSHPCRVLPWIKCGKFLLQRIKLSMLRKN